MAYGHYPNGSKLARIDYKLVRIRWFLQGREEHNIEKSRKVIGHVEILMTEKDGIPRLSFSGGGFFKHEYEKHLDNPLVKQFIDFMYILSLDSTWYSVDVDFNYGSW